jgi:cystathionine beta-synthase
VTYWAKLEHLNPSGSVKDRMALFIVEDAERRGLLRPGGTIVENSSGNTGASLAMIAAVKGYRCIITMPDKMSDEKRRIMEAYGAEVVVTPTDVPAESEQSYYSVARRMASEIPGAFYPDQYNNPLNIEAHYRTTGPELWNQSGGEIDALVAGIGTGGTLSGAGRYLKERNPEIQVVAVDPYGSVFFDYWKRGVPGPPHVYKVEGIGEDYLVEAVDFSLIDEMLQVDDRQSFHLTRRLARQEGIFAGGSSGSVLQGALEYGQRFTTPRNVVVLFADSGSRYLSKLYSDRWLSEAGFAAGLHGSTHTGTDGSHSTGEDAAEDTGGNANEYAIEDTGGNANEYATRIQAGMPARRSHELP